MKLNCETCGQSIGETDVAPAAEGMLIAAHARDHLSPHALGIETVPPGAVHLEVDCLKCSTGIKVNVPREYVGAVTICFHSEHEGHRVRLVVDGAQLYPPG
jgi:hypothetical protein